jgi:hypothetical protein
VKPNSGHRFLPLRPLTTILLQVVSHVRSKAVSQTADTAAGFMDAAVVDCGDFLAPAVGA